MKKGLGFKKIKKRVFVRVRKLIKKMEDEIKLLKKKFKIKSK